MLKEKDQERERWEKTLREEFMEQREYRAEEGPERRPQWRGQRRSHQRGRKRLGNRVVFGRGRALESHGLRGDCKVPSCTMVALLRE